MNEPAKNTDRELWREREGDFYADSLFVTEGGGIGINCGGHVIVKPLRDWFQLGAAEGKSCGDGCPGCPACRRNSDVPPEITEATRMQHHEFMGGDATCEDDVA